MDASPHQRQVTERVQSEYLPTWIAAQSVDLDPETFNPDWSFLTPGMASWFLRAVDEDVVDVRTGWPTLPDARRTYLFEKGRGRLNVYREGFVEVAAAGVLALRFGWPAERLTFQSPRRGDARVWAFDLLAYTDDGRGEVAVAGEAKWRQRDAEDLVRALGVCGRRGRHLEDVCQEKTSDHRKYEGLVAFRPNILWVIGPEAFESDPDLVFTVDVDDDGVVAISRTDSSVLGLPAASPQ